MEKSFEKKEDVLHTKGYFTLFGKDYHDKCIEF